jgi:hypothetical protein
MRGIVKITVSTVYTFDMPKFVYVQIRGTEKPAHIKAETFEKIEGAGGALNSLVLKKGETVIGEFRGADIQGWWIQDE